MIHQYVPLDTMKATERFMSHWHPDLALITESELWPNLIGKIRRYGIPAALINARIS
jgi:3-deoxy-D-manno-octulosonic-acid transferase